MGLVKMYLGHGDARYNYLVTLHARLQTDVKTAHKDLTSLSSQCLNQVYRHGEDTDDACFDTLYDRTYLYAIRGMIPEARDSCGRLAYLAKKSRPSVLDLRLNLMNGIIAFHSGKLDEAVVHLDRDQDSEPLGKRRDGVRLSYLAKCKVLQFSAGRRADSPQIAENFDDAYDRALQRLTDGTYGDYSRAFELNQFLCADAIEDLIKCGHNAICTSDASFAAAQFFAELQSYVDKCAEAKLSGQSLF